MNEKKQFVLNLTAQAAAIGSQIIISFVLTPFVLSKLGEEAYGFIGLVTNFVSYTAIITTSLNSMAGRFVAVSYHAGKRKDAEEYYSSTFFCNCIFAGFVLILSIVLMLNIESLVNVETSLVFDLRITILIAFLNTGISLIGVVFGLASFVTNKLYWSSLAQLAGSIFRVVIICSLFICLNAHMWYYSIAALASTLIIFFINYKVTKLILPSIKIGLHSFRMERLLEIIRNGAWVSLQGVNKLLQTGLDLLIANLFVGGYGMGVLSVARTIPLALYSFSGNIANLFYPKMAETYGKEGVSKRLQQRFSFAMRFTLFVLAVPLVGLIVYGDTFYSLWLPDRDVLEIHQIQLLSVLTLVSLLGSALVEPLYYADYLLKRLKPSTLLTFGFSAVAIVVELTLLMFSPYDKLCIIAGTSSIFLFMRHVIVQPFFCTYIMKIPKCVFIRPLMRELVSLGALIFLFVILLKFFPVNSWLSFSFLCVISVLLGYLLLTLILLDTSELRNLKRRFLRK